MHSSSAQRFKPLTIDVRVSIDPVHWFPASARDPRASLYLSPSVDSFRGATWAVVKKSEQRIYLNNAYRALLPRARQGMVNFVPPRATRDKTTKRRTRVPQGERIST